MDPITPIPQTPAPSPVVNQTPAPQAPVAGALEGPSALLKFGWNIFTKHWKVISVIVLIPSIIMYIGQLIALSDSAIGGIIAFILFICSFIGSIVSMPAATQAVHRLSTDPATPISVKAQYRYGFSVFWSTILIFIIVVLVYMGSFTLFVIPGIIVLVFSVVYMFTFVVDGKKGFSAFTESFNLVRGRWWGVFGRLIVLLLVCFGIGFVLGIVQYLLGLIFGVTVSGRGMLDVSLGALLIQMVIGLLGTVVVSPIAFGYTYRLYVSLKATRLPAPEKSSFKGWLIAFLCLGIISPIVIIGLLSSIVLASLSSARMKGLEAQRNADLTRAQIQQEIDAANLEAIQSNQTGQPVQR